MSLTSLQQTTVTDEPKPQLIAEGIAPFVENDRLRVPPLHKQTFPAITMVGPCPIFYKIPVTQTLVDALITSRYPVLCKPPVPDPNSCRRHGINPLENRGIFFQCLEAMRALLVNRVLRKICAHIFPRVLHSPITNISLFCFVLAAHGMRYSPSVVQLVLFLLYPLELVR